MASLRSQLGKKLSYKTAVAEYQGETYQFGGFPSSSMVLDQGMPDAKAEGICKLWNVQFCPEGADGRKISPVPETFTPGNLPQIKAVLHYLIQAEGEDPLQLTDIADIFSTSPGLFANLYAAAMNVMTASNVVEVAAGNLPAEETAT